MSCRMLSDKTMSFIRYKCKISREIKMLTANALPLLFF